MQQVSNDWKAVQKQQLVNESYIEISFDIADPDSLADATSDDNGAIYIANTPQIVSEVDKTIVPYSTLEQNIWTLDGNRNFIPQSDYGDNGYIGNLLSNDGGGFEVIPTVDVIFSEVHSPIIPGITITWGIAYGEYAEVFKVTAYSGSTVVAEKRIENNSSVMSVVEFDIENYDRIRIEILKWCLPYHRARIAEIFVGVNKIYGKSDITKYEHEQDVDPIGATTPVIKMNFSLDNNDNKYDPNNITGLSKYLMERQEMRVRYGLKLNDGTTEYAPAGIFYLSEWEAPQNGIEANFIARDLLEFLRKTYIKGLYNPAGVSLHSLALDVLAEANLPLNSDGSVKWILDDSLKTIYTTAPLPLSSLAVCLQYIAQAACCILFCDRNGTLHIEPISTANTDYTLTNFNLYARPEIALQKPLVSVDTKVYSYFVEDMGKELFKGKVAVVGTKEIVITYSETAINVTASISDGSLVSADYYSNACRLKITGSGEVTVTITGDLLKSSDYDYVIENEEKGEIQTVENPLITSTTVAAAVGSWVKDWLSNRKVMKIEGWRADPRLDVTDIIFSENKFGTDTVRMTSVKYSYSGAFRGSGEGREV